MRFNPAESRFGAMGAIHACLALALVLSAAPVLAQPVSADRPGIGSDLEAMPQFTLQAKLASDNRDVRPGALRGFEVGGGNYSWGAKLSLADNGNLKISYTASYDSQLLTALTIPAKDNFNTLFNPGTTASWSHAMQTHAGEFNFTPTTRLTITPALYYERKPRAAIFAAWVLPKHDNWQLDLGYDQHKFSAGVSTALDFAAIFKKR